MPAAHSKGVSPPCAATLDPVPAMHLILPIAAIGYSLIYLLFGGGLGGAVIIFIIAKMLGK